MVAELTGVPAATLRAWERRYGIPSPQRSPNGYRQYSRDDVEKVRSLRRLVAEGLSASRAAEQVRQNKPPRPSENLNTDLVFTTMIERILGALRRFDPDALDHELRRALLLGDGPVVYERVMVPVMRSVGELDGLGVAHVHLASEVLRHVAQDLHRLSQPPRPLGLAVLACFPHEQHVLPLYGIAFQLHQRRIRTLVLGAQTPPEAIAVAVERLRPDLIGLSVTMPPDQPEILFQAYADACGMVPWVVGGSGTAALATLIESRGGHLVGGGRPVLDELSDLLPSLSPL